MTSAVRLSEVTLRFGRTVVLDELSLEIRSREVLSLLGPSGSGKSSLLRVVMGLTLPERGVVALGGRVASQGRELRVPPEDRSLAVVFQDLALWPHLSVADNLAFGLRAKGLSRAETDERVSWMLERVRLGDKADRRPAYLSGGERQRVAIARALVLEPDAVLLDEPLAGLDIGLRDDLLDLIGGLLEERGCAAVYVTHDPRDAIRLGGRAAILSGGKATYVGDLTELSPTHECSFARRVARYLHDLQPH